MAWLGYSPWFPFQVDQGWLQWHQQSEDAFHKVIHIQGKCTLLTFNHLSVAIPRIWSPSFIPIRNRRTFFFSVIPFSAARRRTYCCSKNKVVTAMDLNTQLILAQLGAIPSIGSNCNLTKKMIQRQIRPTGLECLQRWLSWNFSGDGFCIKAVRIDWDSETRIAPSPKFSVISDRL